MIYAESGKFLHPNYKNEQSIDKKITTKPIVYQKEMAQFEKNTLKIFKVRRMNVQYSPRKSSTVTL